MKNIYLYHTDKFSKFTSSANLVKNFLLKICFFHPIAFDASLLPKARGRRDFELEGFLGAAGVLFGHPAALVLSIIKRSDAAKGFVLLPSRWVVERTFVRKVKARRLLRDHEANRSTTKHSSASP